MESRGNSRLTIRQGPVPGKVHEMAKDVITLGRDVSNDIVINDAEVSRNHARLTAQSGSYLMEDLASTNGTFVNGQRLIGPKLLNAGDVVGLGETVVLEYSIVASDAGATVIAAAPVMAPRVPDATTAPPRMPDPAPEPVYTPEPAYTADPEPVPQTMAQPIYEPSPAIGSAPPPPPTPLQQPKANNNTRNIAIGCGCLSLCLCATAAVVASQWASIMAALNGF
jgi:pSer/pThr/pTyr-binding forkhead associated (FHA) protein